MDKVKSLLSGGNKKEEESTYDPDSYSQTATHNIGKLTGEGSHLGAATGNTGITSSGVGSTTTGPHSSDIMNKADPRVDSDASQGNTASSAFANKAASTAWSSQDQSAPGSFPQEDNSNPYAASRVDPRVDNVPRTEDTSAGTAPIPTATVDTTGASNNQSIVGRALGAVGLGGAAAKADEHTPSTTTGTDSYGTTTRSGDGPSHHRKESIPTTAYPSGTLDSPRAVAPPVGAQASGHSTAVVDDPGVEDNAGRVAIGKTSTYSSNYLGSGEPTSSVVDPSSSDPTTYRKPETSHLGRDVGIGAGIGAAGVGAASAYDGSRDHPGVPSGIQSGAPTSSTGGEHATFSDAATGGHLPTTSSGVGSTGTSEAHDPTSESHTGRDAAAVGAGAGALGAGAYEYEKHRGAHESATGASTGTGHTAGNGTATSEPYDQMGDRHTGRDAAVSGAEVGAVGAGAHEYSKREEKEREKEQRAHDKAIAKEEKKVEKSERQHEKAMAKEERHREKELAKEEQAHEPHSHRKEEAAVVGAAGAGAVGAHEYDQHNDNLGAEEEKERKPSLIQRILHPRSSKTSGQDETSGLAAADAADSRAFNEHGDASAGGPSTIAPAGYAEAPTEGYASQVTGGTGTTALAQGEGAPSGSHATALGNVFESKDPSVRTGSAPNYPTAESQATGGTTYTEAPSTGYASQVTGGTGTSGLASESAGEPLGQGNLTGAAEHQHGIQGSGLTREGMTGQPGTGHQFGEITDHKR